MKEGTLYRHIFRESWRIAWKNPFLWFLGALSIFWGGIGAYSSIDSIFSRLQSAPEGIWKGAFPSIQDFSFGGLFMIGLTAVIIIALFSGFILLSVSARGGLIYAISARSKKKPTSLGGALQKGVQKFWPILGIGILSRFDVVLSYLLLDPLSQLPPGTGVLIGYVLAFLVTTVVSLVFSLLAIYAIAFVMFEDASFTQAVRQACNLFSEHWLLSLEFALMLYGLNLLVGIVVIMGLLALGIPFVLLGILFAFLNVPGGFLVAAVPLVILYVIFLVIAGSLFVTFQYTTWTLLYIRMREGNPISKVVRVTARYAHILHRKIV